MNLRSTAELKPWEFAYFSRCFYNQYFDIDEVCYWRDNAGKYHQKKFTAANEPLRLVSLTTRDGLAHDGSLRLRAWEYRVYKIRENQGIDFLDWMDLPNYLIDQILDDIRAETATVNNLVEAGKTAKAPPKLADGAVSPDDYSKHADYLYQKSKALK